MLAFLITWLLLAIYSFTRRDLNLILYNFFPYSKFWHQARELLTQLGYYQRPFATLIFFILLLIFIFLYFKLIHQKLLPSKSWLKWLVPIAIIGIISYPMFSHDIFNYLFNAKMVLIYKANPHIHTAIEFPRDLMLRFMHNVHTPAPYAYGWTIISLLPGLTWLTQKLTLSFWIMKLFIALFWLAQLWILKKLIKKLFPKQSWRWWLFALNPLVLMETLIIGHNDVAMMFPVLLSYWFLIKSKKLFDKPWRLSLFLLLISVSIKYATIVLLPLYFLKSKLKKVDLPTLSALLLFSLMFTRLDQMHSWYFIWAFSFAVLSKSRQFLAIFTALSLGALFRYLPYIYYGSWNPPVYLYRQLIWLVSLLLAPLVYRLQSDKR